MEQLAALMQMQGQMPASWMDIAGAAAAQGGGGGDKGKGKKPKYEGEGEPSDNLYIMGLPKEFDGDSVQQFFGAIGNVLQCRSFGNGFALVRFASKEEATMVKTSLHGQKPIGCTEPLTITYSLSKKQDWYCPKCGDLQFQKNTSCRACGQPKDETAIPADGDMPAPGSKGKGSGKPPPQFARSSPYGEAGKGKGGGKDKNGPMCTIDAFITELISGGLPGGDQSLDMNCISIGGLPADTVPQNLYEIFATFGPLLPRGARVDTVGGMGEQCTGTGYVSFIEASCADMAVLALNGIQLAGGSQLVIQKVL